MMVRSILLVGSIGMSSFFVDIARTRLTKSSLQPTTSPMTLSSGTYSSSAILACQNGSSSRKLAAFSLGRHSTPIPWASRHNCHSLPRLVLMCHNNEPLTPSQQLFLCTVGLPYGLRIDIKLQLPSDLHTAFSLAKAYEQQHSLQQRHRTSLLVLQGTFAPPIFLRSMHLQYLPHQRH